MPLLRRLGLSPLRRRQAIVGLKCAASLLLLVGLLLIPSNRETLAVAWARPKDGLPFALAGLLCAATAVGTFARWWLLLRAADVPCPLRTAVRLGFAGYFLNFLALGMVGGDLFRMIALSRRFRHRQAEIAASIVVDRWAGVLGLLLLVAGGGAALGLSTGPDPLVRRLCEAALIGSVLTLVGGIAAVAWLPTPGNRSAVPRGRVLRLLRQLGEALAIYRGRPWVPAFAVLHSLFTQVLLAVVVGLAGHALQAPVPAFGEGCITVALANLSTTIPLPGGGLGAFEWALSLLSARLTTAPHLTAADGLLLAVGYRAVTLIFAGCGALVYALGEAAAPSDEPDAVPSPAPAPTPNPLSPG